MKLKILLFIFMMTTSSVVFAKHYYRFWRGHIAHKMSENDFTKGLNKIFIPETVEQGKNHGLNSYLPVLIKRDQTSHHFPDELALVVYDNEEKYKAIRKMPRGESYQKLHWKYFNKKNSRSLVPQSYAGKIQVEVAYDLLESDSSWKDGKVQFLSRKFKSKFNQSIAKELKEYFKSIQENSKAKNILSHIILIDNLGMYEYILHAKSTISHTGLKMRSKAISTKMNIFLKNKNENITFNEGVNRQF